MKILHFTSIKLSIGFILGTLSGFYTPIAIRDILIIYFIVMVIFGVSQRIKHVFLNAATRTGIILMSVFLTGMLNVKLHEETNHPDHYSRKIAIDADNMMIFELHRVLKPNRLYERYEIEMLYINEEKAFGKVLLNLEKDSLSFYEFCVGKRYAARARLKKIRPPLNPHQFNYKNYLRKKQIYHQIFLSPKACDVLPSTQEISGYKMAFKLREKVNAVLNSHGFKGDVLGVINALLLGQRQGISEKVYNTYTSAGAIHILAVSGLHVGIVMLLLNALLKPLDWFRYGKKAKPLFVIFGLWIFALIAGLSPSVVRAVSMFSFVAWAIHLKRTTNIYNILAISILALLLFKPLFLFDVGFQLSYIAVFAIVWIRPTLYAMWSPPYKILDFLWRVFTVSLAAQIGVLPLSLYHFHQFPGLFFVSNLIIIPVLGIILGWGLLVITLALSNSLPYFLANGYAFVIDMMNRLVAWIAQQEAFLITRIPFEGSMLFSSYIAIIFGVLAMKKTVFSRIIYAFVAIFLLQSVSIYIKYTSRNDDKFIIFHKYEKTILGDQRGNTMKLYSNDKTWQDTDAFTRYITAEWIDEIDVQALKHLYKVDDKLLLRVDEDGIYNIPNLKPNYILLCNAPKINLERLISEICPEVIIADGSNNSHFIERWETTCKEKHIPFHATSKKGAFISCNE